MIDTLDEIETPEGVTLRLRTAGALPRARAWVFDLLLRLGIFMVLMIPVSVLGTAGTGVLLLMLFTLTWGYAVLFEVWMHGQTPGKRLMGLRVVHADGTPVTWLASVLRNLLRVVDALPGVYAVGLASTLLDRQARRLGDIIAGTLVVHVAGPAATSNVPERAPLPLPVALDMDEQAALVDYATRAGQLGIARQEELANLLSPLLDGTRDTAAVERLLAHANWLLGRT